MAKDFDQQIAELTEAALGTGDGFEAPAEVRGFAKRTRDLWGALKAEGMPPMEISQLLCVPMIIHLNGPDLPDDPA